MRHGTLFGIVALLTASSASGLVITGGPVYSLPGGGSCSISGIASRTGGATASCTGVNLASHTNVYFGIRNDTNVNGNTMTGAAPGASSAAVFRISSTTSSSITYTSTTTVVSAVPAFGTDTVTSRLVLSLISGSASVVATGGTPANSGANGDIANLFRITSGSSFSIRANVEASNVNFGLGQACPAVYDPSHATFGNLGDVSKVDVAFYFSDCGDGTVDSPEQCDQGTGVNGTAGSCCTTTCTFKSNGTACTDDGNLCTNDQCNGASALCQHPNNSVSCSDGVFCNGADNCGGGSCSVHAGNPCSGPDGDNNCAESCDEGADNCLAADPNGSACSDGQFCNGADSCSGGSCTTHAGDPCPGPDGDGNCSESCDEAGDNCLAADTNGSACTDGAFCNGADSCSGGTCTTHAGDPCPGLDNDTNCAESCDEGADNCLAVDPDGSLCRPDAGDCDLPETCLAGACPADLFEPATTPCGNPSDTVCTDPDTCDAGGTCQGNHAAISTPCGDPGDTECSNPDACDASGLCSPSDEPSGTPCTPDSETCTEDECDGSGGCDHPPGNMGTECRPAADVCDVADTCNGVSPTCPADGKSTAECRAAADACDAAEICDGVGDDCPTDQSAPDDTPCPDSLFCNGTETCQSGTCSSGSNPCPNFCDEGTDMCLATNCTEPPATTCRTAQKSLLLLINKSDNGKDKMIWKWIKGQSTGQAEFGDPTSTADYSLCIYAGATEDLVAFVDVPANSSTWSELSDKGYKYDDANGTVDGATKIKLKGNLHDKAKILFKGRGGELPDAMDMTPIEVPVKVQLVNQGNSICFEATYSTADSSVSKFKAKQ